GFVDTNRLQIEGPFGDHTGYYTLEEEYPVLEIMAITSKKSPVFAATVVGKPPLEDKYMGYATERIFLPLLKTTAPDLIDYYMPENGVFHNLILAKMNVSYPGHATQLMHAFWGVGQMSFVKHALFVNQDSPDLKDHTNITKYILNRLHPDNILITQGVVDALDHSSPKFARGGKLGIDCTGDEIEHLGITLLSDEELLSKVQQISDEVTALRQYEIDTKNPICVIKTKKTRNQKYLIDDLKQLSEYIKILIIVDDKKNDVNNPYMLLWRVVNNIDASRDIYIINNFIAIDATNKNILDNFNRRWPDDVDCTTSVLNNLRQKGLISVNDDFINKYHL
ncbi:MAG: UbiD family decarboxylase domain-containing protein, partial [Arcobacteraceae bacterium]